MALARSSGSTAEEVEAVGAYTAEALPLAVAGDFEALEAVSREFYGQVWDQLDEEDRVVAGERETFVQRQLDTVLPIYQSDWFRSLLAYDPADHWRQVDVPVLAVFGGKDVQVVAESNEAALRELLAEAGNEDIETLVIPDATHLFQEADTGAVGEYPELEPEFIGGFVEALVDWLAVRAGVDGP
jgi:pimeloyl-ACP methyl ester carboxylesterase